MKRLLLLPSCIFVVFACALSAFGADGMSFELQSYSDPAGRLSVDLPRGWNVDDPDGNIISMSKGMVSFLITEINGNSQVAKLTDALPRLIDEMRKNPSITNLEIVEKAVTISGAKVNIAHAKLAFLVAGKMDYVSDIYVIGGPDARARFGLATFIPASEQNDYRSLFESVVRSISVSNAVSGSPIKLLPVERKVVPAITERNTGFEVFNAPSGLYHMNIPSGWQKRNIAGCVVAVSDGTASIGLMEAAERHKDVAPLDTLPEVIGQLREQSDTFKGLRIVERPSLIPGTTTAHAEITYTQSGKEISADFYVMGAEESSSLILMAHTPIADRARYKSIFDSVAKSTSFAAGVSAKTDNPVAEEKTPAEEGSTSVTRASQNNIHPLYWIRNSEQIVKDGQVILTDENGIRSACISWDGKLLAYSRARREIILVNLSTGKKTRLATVSGETTVSFKDGGSEKESIFPIGFSADNRKVYFMTQYSSVFVGGNLLQSVSTGGGKPSVEYKGLKDAAVNRDGDLLICKSGTILFCGKGGNDWEVDPEVQSIYLSGVGFSTDGRPFYYTSDDVHIISSAGNELNIGPASNLESKPVVVGGGTVVWAYSGKIMSFQDGSSKAIDIRGSNTYPFK